MAFHCMNCNGSMVFDVTLQKMRCLHCDSVCDPEDFVLQKTNAGIRQDVTTGEAVDAAVDDARVAQDAGMARFTCRNCGAELESTEDSMIGFCPYCGSQSMVRELSGGHTVERIIPFTVDKEACLTQYGKFARKVFYLPKEFRDTEYIRKFTGIYMPFYEYDAEFGAIKLKGSMITEHNRRYDVETFYDIDGEVEGTYERGVVFDGSRYLDDEVSERTLPFDVAKAKPFVPAYLAGFYADTSTVAPRLYYADAAAQAEADVIGTLSKSVKNETRINVSKKESKVDVAVTDHHSVLYPMWFLTWRKDDRVAYAVINGESGKVVSDLPLDLRSFAIGCVVLSAIVFVILELLVQPTPIVTSIISLFAALCMSHGILVGARDQYERDQHVNDKGWAEAPTEGEAPGAKKKRKKPRSATFDIGGVFGLTIVCILVAALFVLLDADIIVSVLRFALPVVTFVFATYVCIRIFTWRKHLAKRDPLVGIGVLLATVALNSAIIIVSPVNDGWYYLGDAICILGLIVTAVAMMRAYNMSTTRPLPKLFDRGEVE